MRFITRRGDRLRLGHGLTEASDATTLRRTTRGWAAVAAAMTITAAGLTTATGAPPAGQAAGAPAGAPAATATTADTTGVVITAFRTRGPGGAFDEFVEVRNLGHEPVDISGWALQGCATGSGNPSTRVTVPTGTTEITPGGYFLFVNPTQDQYSGGTTPDLTFSTGIADGGASGVRLVDGDGAMVSGVGTTHPDSQCAEGGGWATSFPTSSPYDLVRVGDRTDETQVSGVNADDFANAAVTPRNSTFDPDEPPPGDLSLECTAPFTVTAGYSAADGPFVDGKAITASAIGGSGALTFAVTSVDPAPAAGEVSVTATDDGTAEIRFSDDVPGLDPARSPGVYSVTTSVTDGDGETATCTVDVRMVPVLNIGHLRGVVPDDTNGRLHVSPYALGSPIFQPGDPIAVQGVVTQLTMEENPNGFDFQGFFIQSLDADPAGIDGFDPDAPVFTDGDPRTSDGLWVSTGTFPTVRPDTATSVPIGQQYRPQLGDVVTLRGPVVEDFQQTVLQNPFVVDVTTPVDTGVDLAAHIAVVEVDPPDDIQEASVYWERLAGMQTEVPAGSVVVSGNDVFAPSTSEFWVIRGDHPVALRDDPAHRRVFRDYHPLAHNGPHDLTQGPGDQNGYRIVLGSFGLKAAADDATTTIAPARSGDTLNDAVRGGLFYSFDKYQVMVDEQPDLQRGADPSAASLQAVEGFDPDTEYSVMVYNVENLYDFRSDPFSGCDLDPDVVPEGQQPTSTCTADEPGGSTVRPPFTYAPRSQEQYDAHRVAIAEQILHALQAPDVITIQEAEKQDVCVPVYDEASPADSAMDCDLSAPEAGEDMTTTERGSGAPDTIEELALEIFILSDGAVRYEASGDAVNGRDVRGITQGFLHRVDRVELVPADELLADPVLGDGDAVDIPYPEINERTELAPWVKEAANPKAVNAVLADDVPVQDGGRFPDTGYVFTRPAQVAKFRLYPEGVGNGTYVERYVTSNHMSAGPDGRVEQRTEQARLNAAVGEAARTDGGQVLVTGDFNVFPRPDDPFPAFKTDPDRAPSDQLAAMYERGFTNLHDVILDEAPENTYSFVFRGVSQILDHVFVDDATLDELVVARFVHVNVDYPAGVPDFEPGRGASDHDPLYARFRFAPDGEPECTSTVTGVHVGPLSVSAGVTCLAAASVFGPVTVAAEASVVSSDGTRITGPVRARDAAAVTLCGTTVAGPVSLSGSSAVTLGDPEANCAGNVITGPVQITGTAGPTVVAGNAIVGPLSCRDNDPAPVDQGAPNTVVGPASGQCRNLTTP
ncbi:lamin tail domain-containing protein [Phytoactinopolyspora limicola]|uniref:lamin tail domain-containing protein n=1 Tax=Phytoactinopolyspora limicola TaxID=2715536 RepID=UPI00140D6C75|nr:lamin tail domain-containing protein [Phytoactinopolyspora limicola]